MATSANRTGADDPDSPHLIAAAIVIPSLRNRLRQVLADRDHFTLDAGAAAEWERINRRSAKELAGLKRLMQRPSPFTE